MTFEFAGESHRLPAGAVIGIIGDDASAVLARTGGRFIGPGHKLDLSPAPVIALAYVLDLREEVVRAQALAEIEGLRRSGSTVLIATFHPTLVSDFVDEFWWSADGKIRMKGDVRDVLSAWRREVGEQLRRVAPPRIQPSLRRGDGRAELVSIDAPRNVMSGADMEIKVTVRFHNAVADPVVGIMVRTRIGMEVYGTNTELEGVAVGPCEAGDVRVVTFRFACNLCPQTYTITAASHDPDGVWHDWMEDAVAFQVADTRYTAGVANLRAAITCSRG